MAGESPYNQYNQDNGYGISACEKASAWSYGLTCCPACAERAWSPQSISYGHKCVRERQRELTVRLVVQHATYGRGAHGQTQRPLTPYECTCVYLLSSIRRGAHMVKLMAISACIRIEWIGWTCPWWRRTQGIRSSCLRLVVQHAA